MRVKELIGKLEGLSGFLAGLYAEANHEQNKDFNLYASFHKGEKKAYKIAYEKLDKIIKEAT